MCVHACNCIVVSDYISVMITGYLSPCVDNYVSAMKQFFFFFFFFQIDAHLGTVNDLAFSNRNRQLSIISCGEDRTIKVYFTWHILSE